MLEQEARVKSCVTKAGKGSGTKDLKPNFLWVIFPFEKTWDYSHQSCQKYHLILIMACRDHPGKDPQKSSCCQVSHPRASGWRGALETLVGKARCFLVLGELSPASHGKPHVRLTVGITTALEAGCVLEALTFIYGPLQLSKHRWPTRKNPVKGLVRYISPWVYFLQVH